MSDDWQKGDLALCISNEFSPHAVTFGWKPNVGGIYEVAFVSYFAVDYTTALDLVEDPFIDPECAWEAHLFRKIRPHQPDEEDAETIRLLTGKPVVVEV